VTNNQYTDERLLYALVRLTKELGGQLAEEDVTGFGFATATLYEQHRGCFARAREEAYRLFGAPLVLSIYPVRCHLDKSRPARESPRLLVDIPHARVGMMVSEPLHAGARGPKELRSSSAQRVPRPRLAEVPWIKTLSDGKPSPRLRFRGPAMMRHTPLAPRTTDVLTWRQ
jgi:hypothetical protein